MPGKREVYEQKAAELILPILSENGFELVDTEFVREGQDYYLRCYIDKPGGITIDDCVLVSRQMNDLLDREDFISESYIFEVSSPGLDRPLKKDSDLQRNIGADVDLKTYRPIDGAKEFTGRLLSFDSESITLGYDGDATQTFLRKEIAKICLSPDF